MNSPVVMDKFFELYKSELGRLDLLHKLDHIFNADESGIDLNARAGKVIVDKKSKYSYTYPNTYGLLFWTMFKTHVYF